MKKLSLALLTLASVNLSYAGTMGPTAPEYSWSGFYLGGNAGYGWGDHKARLIVANDAGSQAFFMPAVNAGALPSSISYDQHGFVGGFQIGYNYQVRELVFGLETEIDGANVHGNKNITLTNTGTGFSPFVGGAGATLNWLFDFRARAGYTVTPRGLIYGTGGFAFGGSKHSYSSYAINTADIFTGVQTSNKTGYIFGAGGEWLWKPNLSFKAEYLYYSLARSIAPTVPGGRDVALVFNGVIQPLANSFKDSGNIVRVGFNYFIK